MSRCSHFGLIVVLGVGSLAPAGSGEAVAQQGYAITHLGTLPDLPGSSATDINNLGQVVGFGFDEDHGEPRRAFLWENWQMIDLGTLGGLQTEAYAINDKGQVVGVADLPDGQSVPFLWENGEMVDLHDLLPPDADWVLKEAFDINDAGEIVGYGRPPGGSRHGFLMVPGAPYHTIIDLGTLTRHRDSYAYAVNKFAQVVGDTSPVFGRAFFWDDGVMIDLGTLGGFYSYASGINDAGQVVGRAQSAKREEYGRAFLWENGTMRDLGTLGGAQSWASDINNASQVVGGAEESSQDWGGAPFLWQDGVMTSFHDLLPDGSGWRWFRSDPIAINDAAQIVGAGDYENYDEERAYLMTPLCENVRRLKVSCMKGDWLQADVKTDLPEGSVFALTNNGAEAKPGTVNARGKATVHWPHQSDWHEVCIEGCPETCAEVECLPRPEQYLVVDLGTLPGGEWAGASALNIAPQIVGSAGTPYGHGHAVLWEDDWIVDLGTLGGKGSSAEDVNHAGQVTGAAANFDDIYRAFLWEDGLMRDLGTLGGDRSWARGLNAHGQVVGRADVENGESHAFLWTDGEMFDLGSLGGTQSQAYDINDAQQITGTSYDADGNMRGFFWNDGVPMRDIGTLGGEETWPQAINDAGEVVGESEDVRDRSVAFLWSEEGGMIDLGDLGDRSVTAHDINNHGQVVGQAHMGDRVWHAFIWEDGVMTDLNDLVPAGCAWEHLRLARGINDRGEIVGSGPPSENNAAFLMTHAYCGDIRKFKVKCSRKHKLTARLATAFRPGTVLTLSNEGEDPQCVIIDALGRGKARWREQSGPREICVEQCRELCKPVECP